MGRLDALCDSTGSGLQVSKGKYSLFSYAGGVLIAPCARFP
jgi:hypothetical protein